MRPAVLLLCSALLLAATGGLAAQERKNVLFIPVDDLRPHLPVYGQPQVLAPNLEKLAAEGTVFLRAYCQQAVCAPSRASLLTGLRPDGTRIYDLEHPVRQMLPSVLTLPQHFKNNGYTTLRMGKVYHHSDDDKEGWSQFPKIPQVPLYADAAIRKDTAARRESAAAAGKKGTALSSASKGPSVENADVPDNAYPDGAMTDAAIAKLKELKAEGKPFFFATGFVKPHLPFCAPKKYWDLYDRSKIQLAAWRTKPQNGPDIAMHNSGELRTYTDIPEKGDVTDDKAKELIHGYYAAISYMDAQVGRLLAALDELGLRDNTVVVLWGDHGWHLGDHGLWNKHTNFEAAAHAPLLVRAPGIAPGKVRGLVEFIDIYPSLCELAGLDKPAHLKGTSFVPLMRDPSGAGKAAAFSQYPRGEAMGYTVRSDTHRYTEWISRRTKDVVARELYDHTADGGETKNIADEKEAQELVKKHAELLRGMIDLPPPSAGKAGGAGGGKKKSND